MEHKVISIDTFAETATLEEYIAFLYLALAGADLDITEREVSKIGRRVSGILVQHFPDTKFEFKSLIRGVRKIVESNSPNDHKHVIESLNRKYHLPLDIQMDVIADLNELISIDDVVDQSEYALMNFIKVCFIGK
jgi:hypothetical protein